MKIIKRRIRVQVAGGQWSNWLTDSEFKRYRGEQLNCVIIEETMSYEEAMKVLNEPSRSAEK